MNSLFNRPWVYKVLSLVFAIGLFSYVNMGSLSTTRGSQQNNQESLANKKQSIRVPLEVQSDTNRYFITGYPEKVTVHVEGPSALVTTTVNTQNFKISADLRKLGVGKHRVKLQQQGINKDLTYRITPKYITVNIQPKQTKTFPIQLNYNKDSIADGYKVGSSKLSQETVQATGSKSDIKKISQVVANLGIANDRKENIDQEVLLQAVDESGKIVNVVLDPETVHVNIPIYLPSQQVDIDFSATGTQNKAYEYSFSSSTDALKVYGPQATLNKIKKLTLPVDVTGITETTHKTVKVNLKGTGLSSSDPASVSVTIKVTKNDTADDESSSAASESSSAASSRQTQNNAAIVETSASSASSAESASAQSSTQSNNQAQ